MLIEHQPCKTRGGNSFAIEAASFLFSRSSYRVQRLTKREERLPSGLHKRGWGVSSATRAKSAKPRRIAWSDLEAPLQLSRRSPLPSTPGGTTLSERGSYVEPHFLHKTPNVILDALPQNEIKILGSRRAQWSIDRGSCFARKA
jgi:hypothetical protein